MKGTYVIGHDGASRAAGDKLNLQIELAEEELVLRLEPRAGGVVKGEAISWPLLRKFARPAPLHVMSTFLWTGSAAASAAMKAPIAKRDSKNGSFEAIEALLR